MEKEVAFFLLKGLSFREIVSACHIIEKTVCVQLSVVYMKFGLVGCIELFVFFFEDLFLLGTDSAGDWGDGS